MMPGRADNNTTADPTHAPAQKALVEPIMHDFPLVGGACVLMIQDVIADGQACPAADNVALYAHGKETGVNTAGSGQAATGSH